MLYGIMNKNEEICKINYICPKSDQCKLNKKCHVLTTVNRLKEPIRVMQICPADVKDYNGKKKEIEIIIG